MSCEEKNVKMWFKTEIPRVIFLTEVSQVVFRDEQSLKEGLLGFPSCSGHVSFPPVGSILLTEPELRMGRLAWPWGRVSTQPALLSNQLGLRNSAGQVPLGAASITNEKIMPLNQE